MARVTARDLATPACGDVGRVATGGAKSPLRQLGDGCGDLQAVTCGSSPKRRPLRGQMFMIIALASISFDALGIGYGMVHGGTWSALCLAQLRPCGHRHGLMPLLRSAAASGPRTWRASYGFRDEWMTYQVRFSAVRYFKVGEGEYSNEISLFGYFRVHVVGFMRLGALPRVSVSRGWGGSVPTPSWAWGDPVHPWRGLRNFVILFAATIPIRTWPAEAWRSGLDSLAARPVPAAAQQSGPDGRWFLDFFFENAPYAKVVPGSLAVCPAVQLKAADHGSAAATGLWSASASFTSSPS